MSEDKVRRHRWVAIAGVLVVVLFQPVVGVLTDTGQGVAYGQAREQAQEQFLSAECVKLRDDLEDESVRRDHMRSYLESDKEDLFIRYQYVLVALVQIPNLRDQIAGLDAAEVFLPAGETRVRGLLQAMRKKADAQLKWLTDIYAEYRDKLNASLETVERSEANLKALERNVEDLNRKLNAAGCTLPPPGNLISSLPPPLALGAPLPPVPAPTTQVPGSVTRVAAEAADAGRDASGVRRSHFRPASSSTLWRLDLESEGRTDDARACLQSEPPRGISS